MSIVSKGHTLGRDYRHAAEVQEARGETEAHDLAGLRRSSHNGSRESMMAREQLNLPFGPLHNRNLFSNHWLENRLSLEPEWDSLRAKAKDVLDGLTGLWDQQRDRVERYGKEQGLEYAFIQPALEILGWKLHYQTHLRGRSPDYALFLDEPSFDAALKAGYQSADYWKFPAILADAKAWDVPLDRLTGGGKAREYPPQQIEWYLNESQLPFAILTNGRLWRLIPRHHEPDQPRFETYLECDLPKLLDLWAGIRKQGDRGLEQMWRVLDVFLRFYLFFSPTGCISIEGRTPLIPRAITGSNEYRLGVGEGLKDRIFKALEYCIEGLLSHAPNGLDPQADLPTCRANSFTLLYRLLFIMYAEDRGLLPYRINSTYTANRSLGRYRDEIAVALDRIALGRQDDYDAASTTIWQDLANLFDLIDRGHARYGVPAYNGGLFDPDAHPFLVANVIPDRYLARVIDQLSRAPDKDHAQAGLFRVDYRDLAIQHLGSIYEGLLELYPHYATEKMVVIRHEGRDEGEECTQPAWADVPRGFEIVAEYDPGHVYLLNQKGERRASGSYYTPNHIVDHIVEKTLGPICRRIDDALQAQLAQAEANIKGTRNSKREALQKQIDKLQADFDDRILALGVCDPAMGSGHFLLRVCQYLAEEVATNPHTSDPRADQLAGDESTLTYWKRRIVEHCIYGVDINPVAVELAKLALWLETAAVDRPLTFLDHHLRCGNSIVGADIEAMGALPGEKVPARGLLASQVTARLPIMLKALADIAAMPSETVQQVKEKEKLYRKVFDPARRPLLLTADIWCSRHFLPRPQAVTPNQYQGLLNVLDEPLKLDKAGREPWAMAAVATARDEAVNCFHWQLEFPEVFFDATGLRDGGGFDAIVGNPPYDVLSEKETGHDLSALKAFLSSQRVYEPSFRGKNNLYKLFVCRAMDLLADGGRLGFITPMAILGDDQAASLRRMVFTAGAFTSIDAFPQKDDASRRIFPEAKLSTAVFTVAKTDDAALRNEPFVSRVHPADRVEPASPVLTLTSTGIPAYDPENLTVVSCSQADWDLAVRIISSGRMTRLEQFTEFYQGEVNETNARKDGCLLPAGKGGKLVTRGACICLYVPRSASQGDDLYLDVAKFLEGKGTDTKAFHHKYRRIGLQESCPQNNFRRVIASLIPAGEFCNHKVNYLPEHTCKLPLEFAMGLLNSKLADWYFRLGSTNAAVSHYQLYNLPCPAFADKATATDQKMLADTMAVLDAWAASPSRTDAPTDLENMIQAVCRILQPAMAVPPYGQAVRDTIVELVRRITTIESARGEIARAARSALAPAAQPYQDVIDRILYHLAGLSEPDWRGLEDRLARML